MTANSAIMTNIYIRYILSPRGDIPIILIGGPKYIAANSLMVVAMANLESILVCTLYFVDGLPIDT
ncbi:MAG: hypothetical protein REV35_02590 [Burkholderia sp.]|nr:hypothetical protein [Burkholderia sp.]